jgi:hypothetical protein
MWFGMSRTEVEVLLFVPQLIFFRQFLQNAQHIARAIDFLGALTDILRRMFGILLDSHELNVKRNFSG